MKETIDAIAAELINDNFLYFSKRKGNLEDYNIAVSNVESMGNVICVETKEDRIYYCVMPIFIGSIKNSMGAGDSKIISNPEEMPGFYKPVADWTLDSFEIRADHVPEKYKKYATATSPFWHPSSQRQFPECDIHGNKIFYAIVHKNCNGEWIIRNSKGWEKIEDISIFENAYSQKSTR